MTTDIEHAVSEQTPGTGKMGNDITVLADASEATRTPRIQEGISILNYVVPPGYRYILKTVLVTAEWGVYGAASPTNPIDIGKGYIRQNSVNMIERSIGCPGYLLNPGYERYRHTRVRNAMPLGWSDGPTFPAGDVIDVFYEPANPTMVKMVVASLWGLDAVTGMPVMLTGRAVVAAGNLTVLTYTVPSNGFTLLGWSLEGWNRDRALMANIAIRFRDTTIEMPMNWDPQSTAKPPTLLFPFHDGITFGEGESVEVYYSSIWQMGDRFVATLFGDLQAVGGQGGSGYSRSRVVGGG